MNYIGEFISVYCFLIDLARYAFFLKIKGTELLKQFVMNCCKLF